MLSEYFIDQALTAAISLKPGDKQSRDIIESIYYILNSYKKETPKDDFPIEFKDKYDLVLYITKYRTDHSGFDFDNMIQGMRSGRLQDFIPSLETKKVIYELDEQNNLAQSIYDKRKLCELTSGSKRILQSLADMQAGIFNDDKEMIDEWESVVNQVHSQLMEVNKMESIGEVSFLDVLNDDYSPVMEKLRDQSDFEFSIKTGFKFLYDSLPAKGFEPCRLYLIGGTSGVGKSTILINFIGNAVLQSPKYKEGDDRDVLLYITAENLIDESLERLYCMMTGIPVAEVKRKYDDPTFSLKPELHKLMEDKSLNIQIVYVQPKKTTVRDIEAMVDKVSSHGKNVKCVYIDYLDLFRSGHALVDLRHELGEVAIAMKNLAVTYRIPVITVTQLNRAGYDNKSEPSLTQMSESMQKIDNSDFVLFLQNDKDSEFAIPTDMGVPKQCKHIKMSILKNRNGPVNKSWNVIMQEKLGHQDLFNFRIEEKPDIKKNEHVPIDDSLSMGGF